ncbi:hypothetical protein GJD52_29410, partial [Klebsiella pneumoniae]|nr:hypothetical protein [Klebsiella pneumoniae]
PVIPGDLLPLPPQNAPARGDQQYRDQGDGQPRPADHTQHAQAITRGLLALASSGELKTREDVTGALTAAGFEVVRTTKNSI